MFSCDSLLQLEAEEPPQTHVLNTYSPVGGAVLRALELSSGKVTRTGSLKVAIPGQSSLYFLVHHLHTFPTTMG